ncbi:ornithine decarboxylase-like [Haliotis rufescens]|uniref:ornithine decarboxylase-like n=1 Tax=Haliotis rufescens TaxID=6454 RepID=UPI00201F09CC|nr:ornithine decarboxylase-like [Haliotis rufescens]
MDRVILYEDCEDIRDIINKINTQERKKDKQFGAAFYAIDLGDVMLKMDRWLKHLPRVEPHFAVKSNSNPQILSLLADLGASFDCASRGEIGTILDMGLGPTRIVYSHSVKHPTDIRYAQARGVDLIAFDNEEELVKMKSLHPNARLLLRIQSSDKYEVEHHLSVQYGCEQNEVRYLLGKAKNMRLNVVGVSFHVGSGIVDGRVFIDALQRTDRVFKIASELNMSLSVVDIGGGFYGHKTPPAEFEEVARHLNDALDEYFPDERGVRIIAEPGRFFVTSCATLVITVIGKRIRRGRKEGEDEYLYFVNDSIFGTFNHTFKRCSRAELPSLLKDPRSEETFKSSVWGQTCAGDDSLFEECYLPELEIGDTLFVENVGAYPMSINKDGSFNGMPQPIPIYVCKKEAWKSHVNMVQRASPANKCVPGNITEENIF